MKSSKRLVHPFKRSSTINLASGSLQDLKHQHQQQQHQQLQLQQSKHIPASVELGGGNGIDLASILLSPSSQVIGRQVGDKFTTVQGANRSASSIDWAQDTQQNCSTVGQPNSQPLSQGHRGFSHRNVTVRPPSHGIRGSLSKAAPAADSKLAQAPHRTVIQVCNQNAAHPTGSNDSASLVLSKHRHY